MISKRIKTIASNLKEAKTIADIGCDHGYLIIEAFLNYDIEKAIAIDNKKMPLTKAIDNLKKYDFYDSVEFILSDGLSGLEDAVDAIVFAGMGGLLIIELIEANFPKLQNARLIIQANRNSADVRKYLTSKMYTITNEEIVFEDRKFYEIIVFEKSNEIIEYSEDDYEFGPILRQEKDELFLKKLSNDLRILNNIPHHTEEITIKIKKIEEYL